MNIAQLQKRLESLADKHGPNIRVVTLQFQDKVEYTKDELCISGTDKDELMVDVIEHNDEPVIAIMPKPYWEEHVQKPHVDYDQV